MKCPSCHASVQAGKVGINRSTAGMIADSLLSSHSVAARYLYFYPDGNTDNPVNVDLSDKAFYCAQCRTLVVQGPKESDESEELTCLSCGKAIPPTKASCPACGWTWGEAGAES